jgi:hypothetical protein
MLKEVTALQPSPSQMARAGPTGLLVSTAIGRASIRQSLKRLKRLHHPWIAASKVQLVSPVICQKIRESLVKEGSSGAGSAPAGNSPGTANARRISIAAPSPIKLAIAASGSAFNPKCSSVALTELQRSCRESISVPSRSKTIRKPNQFRKDSTGRSNGMSYQEIAEALQIGASSVGTKLARAEAEFSALYERHRRRTGKAPQLQTAKEEQWIAQK